MYLDTSSYSNPMTDNAIVFDNVSNNELNENAKKNWLSYWKYFKRSEFNACSVRGCNGHAHHGILVKTSQNNDKLYVVPVCATHSTSDSIPLKSDKHIDIISAELSL
ncbi:hypothetical protein ACWU4D_09860 [Vibrio sp. WJH972]